MLQEIWLLIDDESVKPKNRKGSDAFKAMDPYFQLAFKNRYGI
jgi:hypothetical protein